ncbi:MAG: NAD(P)-dependent dehydrogenase (short-subunit alcohol dehydrogenase family) [Verrucomicrobiales bacterium]
MGALIGPTQPQFKRLVEGSIGLGICSWVYLLLAIENGSSVNSMTSDDLVVITGASRGVGEALALRLASEGRTVAALARSSDKLEKLAAKADAGRIIACPVDVSNAEAVTLCIDALEADHGPIGVLVNNAAVVQNIPFAEQSLETLDDIIDINLKGAMYCTHAAIQHMIPRRRGRIVNIASVAGVRGIEGQASYCASKHGMLGFADALTQELIPHRIGVSTICPGAIDTPLWDPETNPYPGDVSKTIQPGEIVDMVCYILGQPDHTVFKRVVMFPTNEWH